MTDESGYPVLEDADAARVARALSEQYASVYCIDAESGAYVEYASTEPYRYLGIPSQGNDFFGESRANVPRVVHADDVEAVRAALDRDVMLSRIRQTGSATLAYRLMLDNEPIYVRLRASLSGDGACIVVSIRDVDKLVRLEEARQRERDEKGEFLQVAYNLARRFERMLLVDLDADEYLDFSATAAYGDKVMPPRRAGFFARMAEQVANAVHPDDRGRLAEALAREALLCRLESEGQVSLDFQAMVDGQAVYRRLEARLTDDKKRMLVGVADIDESLRREMEDAENRRRSQLYGQIASSLASEYATIYYVDVYTKKYIEFSASDVYRDLGIPQSGDDFFAESRTNAKGLVHPDDEDALMGVLDRDIMTNRVSRDGSLTVTYRLNLGGRMSYTRLHAVWALDRRHLIVGVADVDAEMRSSAERAAVEEKNRIYGYIAQSLANQYANIYYVDVYDESYVEFASSDAYKNLELSHSGKDFFANSRADLKLVAHPDDYEAVAYLFDRERMTATLAEQGFVTATYRLMVDGEPVYTSMRAVWADDRRHLIVGIADVDAQMKKELAQKKAEELSLTYAHIAHSLASRYDSIYYVDAIGNAYTEYSSTDEYKELNVRAEGDDFFAESAKSIGQLVYPEDRDFALSALNKEKLLSALASDEVFSTNYRLMLGGVPTYVNVRAVWAEDRRHLIIGVANVDAEMKREREHAERLRQAHEKAMRDELTGIRNQNAFSEVEAQLARAIEEGTQEPFAIVACDVNGLKEVNDTQGHQAGDAYIKEACRLICETYTHSPVFRTGGDEFVAVLQGSDFANRNALLEGIRATVLANQDAGGVIVATGMSAYKPGVDTKPSEVFARADALMYENKKTLKGARL